MLLCSFTWVNPVALLVLHQCWLLHTLQPLGQPASRLCFSATCHTSLETRGAEALPWPCLLTSKQNPAGHCNPTSPASTSYPLSRSPHNLHLSDCPLLGPSTNLQAIVVYTASQPLFSQCKFRRKSIFWPQCITWRCTDSLSTMKTALKAGRSWPGVCRFQLHTLQFSPLFRHDCHQACWS